jgi:hypothetical protein
MTPNRALLLNLVCNGCTWPSAVVSTTSCVVSVTGGEIKNNRITVLSGRGVLSKSSGENKYVTADHFANDLGGRFDDPRYYGREL